jgi:hypothetical protein
MREARKLAEKRAAELAKSASGKPLSEALKGQTVTGEPKGQELTLREPPKFTWFHDSAATSVNPMAPKPPPEISTVPFVENPGDEFMELVFDQLQVGEAGAAPNADRSVYYVVKVLDRIPGAKEMEALRAKFYADRTELFGPSISGFPGLSSSYQSLAERQQMTVVQKWLERLEQQYAVKWVNPDETVR